ncbi:MAG TPA: BMP family ABC transporter substrate-binding protein [Thermoleophilaceae bacterium]|jgi:basic membrane protein A
MSWSSVRLATPATIVAITAALALSACGGDDDSGGGGDGSSASSGNGGKNLGLAMDVLRNDKSFGQATYIGATKAAKDMGLKLTVVDNLGQNAQKAQTALQNLVRDNDFIINGANALTSSTQRLAQQNPDKKFSVYAVAVEGGPNLQYAYQDWYPLAYLAGVVAGMTTKSNVVGFVGGGEIPPTIAGEQAYKTAVKATNPKAKVLSTITGDFSDPAKGKNATAAQIAQGADVVYSFLDAAHAGAVAAAKEKGGVKLISVVLPKCEGAEGIELGDTISDQSQLVYNLVQRMVDDKLENTVYGIQDPKVATLALCPGEDSPELTKAIEDTRQKFVDGTLETPPDLLKAQSSEG